MNRLNFFASCIALAFLGIQFGTVWFFSRDAGGGTTVIFAGSLVATMCLYDWYKGRWQSWRDWLAIAAGLACLAAFFVAVDYGLASLMRLFSDEDGHGNDMRLMTMLTAASIAGATSSALREAIIASLE